MYMRHSVSMSWTIVHDTAAELSPYSEPVVIQWQSIGNPICLEFGKSVHWNATGEQIVGTQCVYSVLPGVFQWSSSDLPVFSNQAI